MYYDGGCPRCLRGVHHYQRLDWARRVRWVDIVREPTLLEPYGIDFPTAMERLHVLNREGRIVSGVDAFATVWSELPYYRSLAKLVRLRGVLPVLDRMYRMMTRGRYHRRCGHGCSVVPRH
jgi:predicted DCC family thiol-disulfide oxidoreductase YuxK